MTQIEKVESGSTRRNKLCKEIVLAIRALMMQASPDETSKDMAAYIVLALEMISETVDQAVNAWEKRDYWVKADKYKMEWSWVDRYGAELGDALLAENWAGVAQNAILIGQKLQKVEISPNHRLGKPWIGAWQAFKMKYHR
jgi:hypothetical protein